jgi:hypothetical protein
VTRASALTSCVDERGLIPLPLGQWVRHDPRQPPPALRPDHDAADMALDDRSHRSDRVQIVTGVGEERSGAAVEATAVDEQRLVAIIERRPLDLVLGEVKLGNSLGDPVEQL